MEYKLQNILLPSSQALELHFGLFYRGTRCILDRDLQTLTIADHVVIDFATYLNGCSYSKWKQYTELCGAKLILHIEGNFSITLVGYHLDVYSPVRKEYGTYHFNLENKQAIELTFPDNNETIIGFEINTTKNVVLYGGEYIGTYSEKKLNAIELCLATTTCKKEAFIKKNVALIKKEILEQDDDMKNHFYVHVVDNGRTLIPEELEDWHIRVHPNKNTGGSGGYSRGMIESLEQTPRATHVLLMDDDVVVLPEAIKRTYNLLTLLNEKYQNSFISGAMLFYEEMHIQHEDIGTLRKDCNYWSLKGRLYQHNLNDNLKNEQINFYGSTRKYAGWWYCCIPTQVIDEYGLSLPIFIRGDDIEYSLRCNADILTMNGICIWHMGFINKYNLAFDRYMRCRNLLIAQAVGSIDSDVNVIKMVRNSFVAELVRFNYNGARLVLMAVQDYLKGPTFFEEEHCEEILKKVTALNEKYISLSEIENVDEWDLPAVGCDLQRSRISKWWYRITFNGQRFWSTKLMKNNVPHILSGDAYQPGKYTRQKKLLVVNPDLKLALYRQIDKKQYREIKQAWNKIYKQLKRSHTHIAKIYLDHKQYMTSMMFWKQYLELEE